MSSVFIGGSRAVSRLNPLVRKKLDELINANATILVGDANGADKAVQGYLRERGYRHVTVYYVDRCRNNVGSWPEKRIEPPRGSKGFARYAARDQAMARDAERGLMLWDGRSKGTLTNIKRLIRARKETDAYLAPEKAFYKLMSQEDLDSLLKRCDPAEIESAEQEIQRKLPAESQLTLWR
jgi:hypothetical protein